MLAAVAAGGGGGLKRLTHGTKIIQTGDSITAGYPLTPSTMPSYGYVMSQDLGLPFFDRAISGDQSCDIWPLQITPNLTADQPHQASSNLYTTMVGTNDVDVKGVGSYEAVFNTCQQAVLSFLATPAENKVLPGNALYVNTSGSNSATPVTTNGVTYATMTATGVQTETVTTTGNPIYVWQLIKDSTAGSFTISIDGGSALGPYSTTTSPAIATQNGQTASVGLTGRYAVAAGTHTVAYTWVSGTVGIVGAGSIPFYPLYSAPTIIVGQVPNQGPTGATSTPTAIAEYNTDVAANVALIAGDGGDVRLALDDNYMLATSAEMTGGATPLHPGPVGHVNLAHAFENTLQAVPNQLLPWSVTTAGAGGGTTAGNTGVTMNITGGAGYATALGSPIGTAGALSSVTVCFLAAPNGTAVGTIYILTSPSSGNFAVADSFTITPAASTGCQTFTAGTAYTARSVTAAEYLAYSNPTGAMMGYSNVSGTDYYDGGTPSSTAGPWNSATATLALSAVIGAGSIPTSNVVALPGMTASGHCGLPNPANGPAVTNDTAPNAVYVSAVGTAQITITNPAIAGMIFTGVCTSN
jgi:hypothetical protein